MEYVREKRAHVDEVFHEKGIYEKSKNRIETGEMFSKLNGKTSEQKEIDRTKTVIENLFVKPARIKLCLITNLLLLC